MNTVNLIIRMKCVCFFITNIDMERIYLEYNGSISSFLNSSLHESLILEFVMILICPFLNFKNLITIRLISPKSYPVAHNRVYVRKVDHSQGFWRHYGLDHSR